MALVFQYGSNMSIARLNGVDRLAGDAEFICIAHTVDTFDLMFTVWSKSNNCAAADLVPSKTGRSIYGVVYEVPDYLLSRDTAKEKNRRSLDQIEGEGVNYLRNKIEIIKEDGSSIRAITYLVKTRSTKLKTSLDYVRHLLIGLKERNMPDEYQQYVRTKIIGNNSDLKQSILTALG